MLLAAGDGYSTSGGFLIGMALLVVWLAGMTVATLAFSVGESLVRRFAPVLALITVGLTVWGFERYGDDAVIVGAPMTVAFAALSWRLRKSA